MIQIREEIKEIHLKDVASATGCSEALIEATLCDSCPQWPTKNRRLSRKLIEFLFHEFRIDPISIIPQNSLDLVWEWKDIDLITVNGGLFLSDNEAEMLSYIQRYGWWNSQGMVNHVHVIDYVRNPVMQLFAAKHLINIFAEKIRKIGSGESIIYWNGRFHSSVCVYSRPPKEGIYWDRNLNYFSNKHINPSTDAFTVEDFDNYLKIKECIVWEWGGDISEDA